MSSENFKILREISSLDQNIKDVSDKINSELKRVSSIELSRSQASEDQDELEAEKKKVLIENIELEKKIEQNSKTIENIQAQLLTPQGGMIAQKLNKQTDEINAQKEESECIYFENLERLEELEEHINDKQEFLKGSISALAEISEEVDKTNSEYQSQIDTLNARTESLLAQLPENFRKAYLRAKQADFKVSLFSKIIDGSCNVCKMVIPKQVQDTIEKNLTLKTCNGCSRIVLPFSSL